MPLFENELGGSFKLEITFGNEAMKTRSDLISAMKRAVETLRQVRRMDISETKTEIKWAVGI